MNYAAHYGRLMARARDRTLNGYAERHHVLPRCMGGGDDQANIVVLTPEEHYVAHQLLVRMHPSHPGLGYAAVKMAKKATGRRAFAWLRRRHAAASAQTMRGNSRARGYKFSAAARAAMSASRRGKPVSAEHRANLAKAMTGKTRSPEARAKIGAKQKGNRSCAGRKLSAETRARMSASHSGKVLSDEHRAKLSVSLRGNRHAVGLKHSAATLAKIAAASRAYWERRKAAR